MDDILQSYETACRGAVLFDLSARAKIELSGTDARLFLHNLCTNDVKNLAEGQGCEAFLITAKARVIAHVWIGHYRVANQSVLWLDAAAGQSETLLKHLNHYIVSEQVEVADRTSAMAMYRVVGPRAQAAVESLGASVAGLKHLQHVALQLPGGATGFVRRFDSLSLPAFDVIAPEGVSDLAAAMQMARADLEVHEILRIEGGLPEFGKDMDENRLVMEVNRTAQAISYTKGCFLGQEPIVMARDRGQVNRLLLGVKAVAGEALASGTRLFKGDAEIGHVTSSTRSPRLGQVIALAYLKRGNQEPGLELIVEPKTADRTALVTSLPFLRPDP